MAWHDVVTQQQTGSSNNTNKDEVQDAWVQIKGQGLSLQGYTYVSSHLGSSCQ